MIHKITFREQIKGFPFLQVFLVAIVRLAEPIAFTSLFPYVYFMVRNFHIAPSDNEISKYSGYLATVFSVCQICCMVQWGRAAERFGRKRIVMCGMTGTGLSMLLLGFSKNYYMALFARGLMGAVNGNVAIIRTMLGEIAVQRHHQALAFIIMPLMAQVGSVIGPSLGGYLTNHDEPLGIDFLDRLNENHPFALINIVVSSLLFFNVCISFLFIQETHPEKSKNYDVGVAIGDKILGLFGIHKVRPWHNNLDTKPIVETEETPLLSHEPSNDHLDDSDEESLDPNDSFEPLTRRASQTLVRTESSKFIEPASKKIPWKQIITPNLLNIGILWFFQNIQDVVFIEFLPIFLSYDLMLDEEGYLKSKFPFKIVGGLGFNSIQTGRLLSTTGALGIIVILVVFPYVDRNFNPKRILRIFLSMVPICFLLLPFVVFLAPNKGNGLTTYRYANLFIYALAFLRTSCSSNIKPQLSLLTHRGAPENYKAVVNSMVVTISSSSRAVGPLIWGHIFSFAQKHEIAWLSWWSLFIFSAAGFVQGYFIDTYDEEGEEEIERIHQESNAEAANRS